MLSNSNCNEQKLFATQSKAKKRLKNDDNCKPMKLLNTSDLKVLSK
jgi:hypothetical protein